VARLCATLGIDPAGIEIVPVICCPHPQAHTWRLRI
jgi:hypothetical protein